MHGSLCFFSWLWKYARRAFVAVEFDSNGLWLVFACLYVLLFLLVLVFRSRCVLLIRDECACMRTLHICAHTIGKCVWLCSLERNKNKTIDAKLFCLLQYSIAGTEVVELHCDTTYVLMHWELVATTSVEFSKPFDSYWNCSWNSYWYFFHLFGWNKIEMSIFPILFCTTGSLWMQLNAFLFHVTNQWIETKNQGLLIENTCHFFVWIFFRFQLINRFELHTFQWNNDFPVIDRFLSGITFKLTRNDAQIHRAHARTNFKCKRDTFCAFGFARILAIYCLFIHFYTNDVTEGLAGRHINCRLFSR